MLMREGGDDGDHDVERDICSVFFISLTICYSKTARVESTLVGHPETPSNGLGPPGAGLCRSLCDSPSSAPAANDHRGRRRHSAGCMGGGCAGGSVDDGCVRAVVEASPTPAAAGGSVSDDRRVEASPTTGAARAAWGRCAAAEGGGVATF